MSAKQFELFHKDMVQLKKDLKKKGFDQHPVARVAFEWIYNLLLMIVPSVLYFFTDLIWLKAIYIFLAGIGMAGVGTCAHMASHGSATASRSLNNALDLFGMTLMLGVSAKYWAFTHNEVHHRHTNIVELDYDTTLMPWFLMHEKQIKDFGFFQRLYYRYQWIIFPVLVCLNTIDIQRAGWVHLYRGIRDSKIPAKRVATEAVLIVLHYLLWIVLPAMFWPLGQVVLFYFLRSLVTGVALFCIIAPTHYPAEAPYFEKEGLDLDYYSRQVLSTINYKVGFFGRLMCNGIENHIQHHIYPQVSHVLSPRLGEEIQAICKKHGLPYRTWGWGKVIWKSYKIFFKPKPVDNSSALAMLEKPA